MKKKNDKERPKNIDQKGSLIYALNLTERGFNYLCVESNQKGPLIYALNQKEKGLQICMRRI